MKRDADKNPYDIDSKFHANMVYQSSSKDMKALDAFQVITDEDFYDSYKDKYKMESLNSTLVDGAMKRFYEIDLKEFVNIGEFCATKLNKNKSLTKILKFQILYNLRLLIKKNHTTGTKRRKSAF